MKKENLDAKYERGVEVVGSAIIEDDNGHILLTKSPKWNGKWILPGGHIESGETIADAIVREAEEETGLRLTPKDFIIWGELIGSKDFHRPAHFIYFDIHCKLVGGNLKLDARELTESKWLSPKEALELELAESYPDTIQKFIKYLENKS